MRRFFFDFREVDDRYPDTVGTEFANVEEAYLEAFKAAQEMWGELLKQRRDPRLCRFEVRSAGGDALFVLPFQEVLDSCRIRCAPLERTFEDPSAAHSYAWRASSEFAQQMRATNRARAMAYCEPLNRKERFEILARSTKTRALGCVDERVRAALLEVADTYLKLAAMEADSCFCGREATCYKFSHGKRLDFCHLHAVAWETFADPGREDAASF
jgi:hypothetical protein